MPEPNHNLTGRGLHRYKLWRQEDGDLNKVSLKSQMDTLRVFIRFCETVDAIPTDLHSKIISPTLSDGTGQRDVKLDSDEAEALLDYLGRFENPKQLREKWAGADSNCGYGHPKAEGYQATPPART